MAGVLLEPLRKSFLISLCFLDADGLGRRRIRRSGRGLYGIRRFRRKRRLHGPGRPHGLKQPGNFMNLLGCLPGTCGFQNSRRLRSPIRPRGIRGHRRLSGSGRPHPRTQVATVTGCHFSETGSQKQPAVPSSHSHRQSLSAATSPPETRFTSSPAATFTASREPEASGTATENR